MMNENKDENFLEIQSLSARYEKILAIHDISLQLGKGQIIALIGSNGAGKSTFLRCVSGLKESEPDSSIRFQGREIVHLSVAERVQLGMAHVLEGRALFSSLSVLDNLLLGAYLKDGDRDTESTAMFKRFPILEEKQKDSAGSLSGGQQQMLAIARALMNSPSLLLLDEPSMGLSPILVKQVFEIINELRSQNVSILLVEQNALLALQYCDYAYVIDNGRIVLQGKGADLLKNDEVKNVYLGV